MTITKNDEEDGNQVIPDVELRPGVFERLETALVGRQFLVILPPVTDQEAKGQQQQPYARRDAKENQNRKILL